MMRPLEPEELLARCDLAGEAKVLTVGPNPLCPGIFARLEFTRIAKGRVESFRNELRGIAIVKSGSRWLPTAEVQQSQDNTLNIPVARLRRKLGSDPAPILGSSGPVSYKAGTCVFTHLNWDPSIGVYVTSWWNAVSLLETQPGP